MTTIEFTGLFIVIVGIALPLVLALCSELANPLRFRGEGLNVEFFITPSIKRRDEDRPLIVSKIELEGEDMTNVVMFPNQSSEPELEEQHKLFLVNLMNFFKSKLQPAQQR